MDYVIISEGNTSARIDKGTFWVKASGTRMHQIGADGFVQMRFGGILGMLDGDNLTDEEVERCLTEAMADPVAQARPSLETMLHVLALTLGEAIFVGHTHPTAINAILCSQQAKEAIRGCIFPDHITVCGPAPAFVPYADPGLPLGRKTKESLQNYLHEYGEPPRAILFQNHGMAALGKTPAEVSNITAMWVKAASILVGTFGLGGPHFMSQKDIMRIHTRPDEIYRQKKMSRDKSYT